jgi:hypothetical protein
MPMNANNEVSLNTSARARFEQLIQDAAPYIPSQDLQFATEEEYAEILQHIADHKYLTNERIPFEITMEQTLFSWYENVYFPLMQAIEEEGLEWSLPDATRGELLLWVTRHWHFLKQEKGPSVGPREAVHSYGSQFGVNALHRLLFRLRSLAA